jgi:hypothetical protein
MARWSLGASPQVHLADYDRWETSIHRLLIMEEFFCAGVKLCYSFQARHMHL